MSAPPDIHRRAELLASLGHLRSRIVDAALGAGRDPRAISLVAVTKTFPVSDAATLLELGVYDLGESRDQEAKVKAGELTDVRWHFLGRLQTNKARSIASYATAVHSVDRAEVIGALADAADRLDRAPLKIFLQISVDGDPSRGGAAVGDLGELADLVVARDCLQLQGIMAIAPLGMEAAEAFAFAADASADLVRRHPAATAISAGMSGDFEQAIAAGSTHLRVGSALLGRRAPDFG